MEKSSKKITKIYLPFIGTSKIDGHQTTVLMLHSKIVKCHMLAQLV